MKMNFIDILFLLSLLLLYFLPKKSKKYKWFWIITLFILSVNLGIRMYLINQKHDNANTINNQRTEIENLKKETKRLTTRGTFQPLSNNMRNQILDMLNTFIADYKEKNFKVRITAEHGSHQRHLMAQELHELLKTAGFEVIYQRSTTTFLGHPPPIVFKRNVVDSEAGEKFMSALSPMFMRELPVENSNKNHGHFEIHIIGGPFFTHEGVVSFQ